jgi:hypothetical protein
MSLKEDLTLENASLTVKNNLELWKTVWAERTDQIHKFGEGTYGRNILVLLPDLIDEVEHNEERFINNEHGKRFFWKNFLPYYTGKPKDKVRNNNINTWQKFAHGIQTELGFILESLQSHQTSGSVFRISHLISCLHQLDTGLRSPESCALTANGLFDLLTSEEQLEVDNQEVIFLTDTLILMFWRNGTLPSSINHLASDILDGFQQFEDGKLHSSYPQYPDQGTVSNEEYRKTLEVFFSHLPIKDRFNQIQRVYSLEPKEYEVIFKVDGFEKGTVGFSIGNIEVYDPEMHRHIKKPILGTMDIFSIEKVEGNKLCVSVRIRGIDSSSMKLVARKGAERALGLITGRKTGQRAPTLSSAYAICDAEGNEVAAGSEEYKLGITHFLDLAKWKEKEYKRIGAWINNESIAPAVKVWLASMDWYRKAIENEQSSEILLNAWFSVEHLFQGGKKVSLRIPAFLCYRPDEKNVYALWYPEDRIAQIQLLLSLLEIKHELLKYVSDLAVNFLPSSQVVFQFKYGKKFLLPENILSKFVEEDGATFTTGGFISVSDNIIFELETNHLDGLARQVKVLRDLFFQKEISLKTLRSEIWRVKDDVYNIYRIRNMLVHRATTNSILVDYYAARALEYSFSLLTELKWKLIRTKDDSEITDIDNYFQEWVLDANIGLEAVQNGDMGKFRSWVFS